MSKKISQLPNISSVTGSNILPIVSAGTSYQASITQLASFLYASPVLTGSPTTTTPAIGDNTQRIANTAWTKSKIESYFPISVANGGTGASDATTARTNLKTLGSTVTSKSSNYSVTSLDSGTWFEANAGAGAITFTLPDNTSNPKSIYSFRKTDSSANTVTITCNGTDTLVGQSSYILKVQRQSITLISAGNGSWLVQSSYSPLIDSNTVVGGIVDLSSDQTIGGNKTFSNTVKVAGGNGITTYVGGDVSKPVSLTPYVWSSSTEYGISVPLLKVTNGRFDLDPSSGRSELRLNGSTTQFGIYNSTNSNYLLRITSDLQSYFGNTVNVTGGIIASGAASFNSLGLSTPLPITSGGTGAITSSLARSGLGAAASGANSDITSLSGLTTALSIGQGGTGATTASAARTALGVDPTTAQYNASQIQGKNVSSTTPTTGQALVFDGTNYVPRQAGKIVQVVYGFTTTSVSNSSQTYTSTGITGTITPSSTASKVLVTVNIAAVQKNAGADTWSNFQLKRGSTVINVFATGIAYTASTGASVGSVTATIQDSPATTSATTYTVEFANGTASGSVTCQVNSSLGAITLMELA